MEVATNTTATTSNSFDALTVENAALRFFILLSYTFKVLCKAFQLKFLRFVDIFLFFFQINNRTRLLRGFWWGIVEHAAIRDVLEACVYEHNFILYLLYFLKENFGCVYVIYLVFNCYFQNILFPNSEEKCSTVFVFPVLSTLNLMLGSMLGGSVSLHKDSSGAR